MSEWTDRFHSVVYLSVGKNGVANVYCEQHGCLTWELESWGQERPWTDTVAAVTEHLATYHPDLPPDGRTPEGWAG